jgi:hypothetical protein
MRFVWALDSLFSVGLYRGGGAVDTEWARRQAPRGSVERLSRRLPEGPCPCRLRRVGWQATGSRHRTSRPLLGRWERQ